MSEEVQAVSQPENAGTNEAEQRAKALGWKSPDEWGGEKPAGYIAEPEKYVDWVTKNPGVKALEKTVSEIREHQRRMEHATQMQIDRMNRQHQAELERIQTAKLAAVEAADMEQYKALDKQERQMSQPEPRQQQAQVDPAEKAAVDNWIQGKDWFGGEAHGENIQRASQLWDQARKNGLSDPKAILAYVDRMMEPPKQQQQVDPGLNFPGASGGDAFAKLPKEAQEQFRKDAAKGWFADTKEGRAQYARDYNGA